jgi:hypothetical protein
MSSPSIFFVLVYLCCMIGSAASILSYLREMLEIATQRPDGSLCIEVSYRVGFFQPYQGTLINNLCQHYHLLHCNSGDK